MSTGTRRGRHRRLRQRHAGFAVILLLIGMLAGVLPIILSATSQPAQASALSWQQQLWSGMRLQAVAMPDGGVTVVDCSGQYQSSPTMVKQFGPDGVVDSSVAASAITGMVACNESLVAAGADGSVYFPTIGGGAVSIRAVQGGQIGWTAGVPSSANCTPASLGTAANGNVYLLLTGCNSTGDRLYVVNSVGQLVADRQLNGTNRGQIAVYADGVAVMGGGGVQYYDATGNAIASHAANVAGFRFDLQVSSSGRIFVPLAATGGSCPTGGQSIAGGIMAYQSGGAQWSQPYALPSCSMVLSLRPTPSGGVVAVVADSQTNNRQLIALNSTGAHLWTSEAGTEAVNNGLRLDVIQNGNVLWVARQQQGDKLGLTARVLSGGTGSVLDEHAYLGPDKLFVPWLTNSRTIALSGRLFMANQDCKYDGGVTCITDFKLDAINLEGMDYSYPTGQVFGGQSAPMVPELVYAALGDSFSSGEGAPDPAFGYELGTDVFLQNECHRSPVAYPRLLDKLPGLSLDLSGGGQSNFVACSGAKTENIASVGQNSEPIQKGVLSEETDVVTLTLGGNDIGFKDFVLECLFLDCSLLAQHYLDESDLVAEALGEAYDVILDEAPNAKIYVAGYPQIITDSGCVASSGWMQALNTVIRYADSYEVADEALETILGAFGILSEKTAIVTAGQVEITYQEAQLALQVIEALNATVQDEVEADPRMVYVDTLDDSPFEDNGLCSSNPYFNGITINLSATPILIGDLPHSFHPNIEGHWAYAELFRQYMQGERGAQYALS